jgi:hypothetical protein
MADVIDVANYILEISREEIEVNPADIPPSTDIEKKELLKILEKAEANGEINLSRFCIPMGA